MGIFNKKPSAPAVPNKSAIAVPPAAPSDFADNQDRPERFSV